MRASKTIKENENEMEVNNWGSIKDGQEDKDVVRQYKIIEQTHLTT